MWGTLCEDIYIVHSISEMCCSLTIALDSTEQFYIADS
jgi:hypothetical protein